MTENRIKIKGLNIYYRILGEGKPLLILHGWGSKSERWQTVGKLLAGKGFQVIIPDLPGFGNSGKPQTVWGIDDYTEFVSDFVNSLSLNNFHLLGHSFGGTLAIKSSLRFPQKIQKMFLVSAACLKRKTIKKKVLQGIAKTFKFLSFIPFLRKAFYKFIVRKSDYPHAQGIMKEIYLKVIKEDLSNVLNNISVPVLIIWGEKDDITPLKQAYLINAKIKNSKIEIISKTGHDLNSERPGMLVDLIS